MMAQVQLVAQKKLTLLRDKERELQQEVRLNHKIHCRAGYHAGKSCQEKFFLLISPPVLVEFLSATLFFFVLC